MQLFLAGRFAERERLQVLAERILEPAGFPVRASWLTTAKDDAELTDAERREWSERCFAEILEAHAVVYVPSWIPGLGRHREIGYALAWGIPVVLVGDRTKHPHDWHPGIVACDEAALVPTLQQLRAEQPPRTVRECLRQIYESTKNLSRPRLSRERRH